MKIAILLALVVLPLAATVACKKDDGTAPNPKNPAGQPTAGATETPAPPASAASSTPEKP